VTNTRHPPHAYVEEIRLLVEEDGQKLYRTLRGWLLNGMLYKGQPSLGLTAQDLKAKQEHFVLWAENGKVVVYTRERGAVGEPGTITVYDSFEAASQHLPQELYRAALVRARLLKEDDYPERPLEF
jgi:hypothetical protein